MARIAFEKIMAGLDDALAYADGNNSRGTVHRVNVLLTQRRGDATKGCNLVLTNQTKSVLVHEIHERHEILKDYSVQHFTMQVTS